MSSIPKSKELFINMKNVPEYNPKKHFFEQKKDTLDFYLAELEKIKKGVYIGGYHVHPLLYWHLNFFKTPIPQEDGTEKIMCPPLDDNFIYFTETYKEAEDTDNGVGLFGSRGFSKSVTLSSLTSWIATIKANGTGSVIGGSNKDLGSISALLETAFTEMHPAFHIPRISTNWKEEIVFGVKKKNHEKLVHSRISIANAEGGTENSSEKGAGLSPVNFIVDEALHEDCIVYTEDGAKTMKEVQPGDFIYAADGELTEVESKINPGVVDTYKFTFADGREVIASGNHKWKVYDQIIKGENKWCVKTTDEIREKYYYEKYDSRYDKTHKSFRYAIPNTQPVNLPEKDLPIDPYWLAIWLGDGMSASQAIGTPDKEIIEYYKNYAKDLNLDFVCKRDETKSEFYYIRAVRKIGSPKSNPLLEEMRALDLIHNKHIPEVYLKGSIEQRLELLRGLLDTDGYVSKGGAIEFSTSIPRLAEDFKELCRSLGISIRFKTKKPHYRDSDGNKVVCKDSTVFKLHTDLDVFKLPSKRNRITDDQSSYNYKKKRAYIEKLTIVNIEYVGKNQVYCIGIKNPSKLFLTDDYIVTHNCGKFDPTGILQSALPSFMTPNGAKLVHLLAGTGGNTTLSKPARYILENPKEFRLLPMNFDRLERGVPEAMITWKDSYKDSFCTFVPGQMSYRLNSKKIPTKFSDYIGVKSRDLDKIKINVTDWVGAKEVLDQMAEDASSSEESKNKNLMYYPTKIADCFLTSGDNPFPIVDIQRRIRELKHEGNTGRLIELIQEDGKNKAVLSDKQRADVFHEKGNVDAPIIVYGDVPEIAPPKFKYVAGHDGYKIDTAKKGSLGTFYILERRNLEPNKPIERIVASYSSRPPTMLTFLRTGERMIKTWGAMCNMESVDMGFKRHLENKGEHFDWLATSFTYGESAPTGRFGLYPSAGNNEVRLNLAVAYANEEHTIGIHEETGAPIIKKGVDFIDDIDLLEEMLNYKPGGNFDRLTAFSYALAYSRRLDKLGTKPEEEKTEEQKEEDMYKYMSRKMSGHGLAKYGHRPSVIMGNSRMNSRNGGGRRLKKY